MPYRLAINHGQRAGVRETDRAHIHVWPCLVWIVRTVAEHLSARLELGVDLEANGGAIHTGQYAVGKEKCQRPLLLREDLGEPISECLQH